MHGHMTISASPCANMWTSPHKIMLSCNMLLPLRYARGRRGAPLTKFKHHRNYLYAIGHNMCRCDARRMATHKNPAWELNQVACKLVKPTSIAYTNLKSSVCMFAQYIRTVWHASPVKLEIMVDCVCGSVFKCSCNRPRPPTIV